MVISTNSLSKKILITTFLPIFNKGELELLEGILKTFNILGPIRVSLFSFFPLLDAQRYPPGIKLIEIGKNLRVEKFLRSDSNNSRLLASVLIGFQHLLFIFFYRLFGIKALKLNKNPIWQEYCSSDAFVVCTDEDDCVNGPGTFIQLGPVYISMLAKIMRKSLVIYANSSTKSGNIVWIANFHSRHLWKVLAKFVLKKMDLITVRDKDTFVYYRYLMNGKEKLHLTGDPGVLMDSADLKTVNRIMDKENIIRDSGILIGVAITRRLLLHSFKEYSNELVRYNRSIEQIAKVFDWLAEKYNAKVIFIPHCIGYYRDNDDRVVGQDIADNMRNKFSVKVVTNEYSAQELKGLLGQFDFFIGDRIHALISALSMNTPCCSLAYKTDGRPYNLIGRDYRQEKWLYEIDSLNANALFELLTELIESSTEIRKSLPSITQIAKERALLNGHLLSELLNSEPVS
jgi:colanic acid/amylovoran biosynthesis protein